MIRRFDFPGWEPDDNDDNESLFPDGLVTQHENITLINDCAKKLNLELKGFISNNNLELYYDIYKNGRDIGYVYKGWKDPGFRIAHIIDLDKQAPDFKERFYEIFKICSSHLITMALKERDKESLSITLEIGVYKSGFNAEVLKEAIEELEDGLVAIRPLI